MQGGGYPQYHFKTHPTCGVAFPNGRAQDEARTANGLGVATRGQVTRPTRCLGKWRPSERFPGPTPIQTRRPPRVPRERHSHHGLRRIRPSGPDLQQRGFLSGTCPPSVIVQHNELNWWLLATLPPRCILTRIQAGLQRGLAKESISYGLESCRVLRSLPSSKIGIFFRQNALRSGFY